MTGLWFVRRMADFIRQQELFSPEASIVVGVSGGADSIALLHAIQGLNSELGFHLKLHVAHLDHALRGEEAKEDAEFVRTLSQSLNLPCTLDRVDVRALNDDEKGSIEEIARRERYAFLERVCVATNADTLAVGHHADDNAETVLHRILRGTGIRGVAGISPKRSVSLDSEIAVVRPLLPFTREEILRFIDESHAAYREDSSNALLDVTRNRIRNQLIPQIENTVNPQVRDALLRLSEQARWASEYVRTTVARTFETLVISRTDQELVLNAPALARKSIIVQTELIREAIASFEVGEQSLSFGHLKSVADLLAKQVSGRQVKLPAGVTAQMLYDRLVFSMSTEESREKIASQIAVHVPGRTLLPIRRMEIECWITRLSADDLQQRVENRDPFEEWLDLDNVHLPLVVRTRRPGDRFWPLGSPGTKKVSDFLSDMKVELPKREITALLCDQLGPVWVVGLRIDERVKLTRITREALRIRVRFLND